MKRIPEILCCILLTAALAACGVVGRSGSPAVSGAPVQSGGSPADGETEIEAGVSSGSGEESGSGETEKLQASEGPEAANEAEAGEDEKMKMNVQVGDAVFTATLADNAAARALAEQLASAPVVILMSDYAGFEKVGAAGVSLPADDIRTTTEAGDIVLYNGNQIVIFYGSNTWSYTRLGRIDDLTGWEEALGKGEVTVTFFRADA